MVERSKTPQEILSEAEAYGIDLSLLYERLALTPEERLRKFEQALPLVEALRDEGRRQRLASNAASAHGLR